MCVVVLCCFFFKQKTAYEMRIGDWSSDVCSSDLEQAVGVLVQLGVKAVIAPSFSGLYFRNAYNLGLLAIVCEGAGQIPEGARVDIDAANALIRVWPTGVSGNESAPPPPQLELPCQKIPDFLIQRALSGGLMRQLERQYPQSNT